jgi:hypothetical protein
LSALAAFAVIFCDRKLTEVTMVVDRTTGWRITTGWHMQRALAGPHNVLEVSWPGPPSHPLPALPW